MSLPISLSRLSISFLAFSSLATAQVTYRLTFQPSAPTWKVEARFPGRGEETLDVMGPAADALAAALPNAERRAIPAAQHQWQPEQMAETIAGFLDEHLER